MHDWLYANQGPSEDASAFTKSRLAEIAKAAGLDMSKFQPCLDSGTHNDAIAAEQTNKPAEVKGTPTVYVNGKLVVNNSQVSSYTYADIKAAIDGVGASPAPSVSAVPSVSASAKPS
jgi:protein-disulfide isomerase